MGVKINQETMGFEPWEPVYLFMGAKSWDKWKNGHRAPFIFFDSLNWKLFALSLESSNEN